MGERERAGVRSDEVYVWISTWGEIVTMGTRTSRLVNNNNIIVR